MSFLCPKCESESGVVMTRDEFRRRRCKECKYGFWTEEIERAELPAYDRPGRPTNAVRFIGR